MLIIDRIEEDFAVCELVTAKNEQTQIIIEKEKLPADIRAGDVLMKEGSEYVVDKEQTAIRREKINKLQNSLWD